MNTTLRNRPNPFDLYRALLPIVATLTIYFCAGSLFVRAGCTKFGAGVPLGAVSIKDLDEASGIAASRRNPGVLWTHNDGSGGEIYAVGTTGIHLATFYLNRPVIDKEDIAVGPGPVDGLSYLYVGDIGGNAGRRQVTILRVPEPSVNPAWFKNPPFLTFAGVNTFTLIYPDGDYDAESLMVDPLSHDVLIVTKQKAGARVYRANLTGVSDGSKVRLEFVRALPFAKVSGGDISADGTLIVVRREDSACAWERFADESVASALSRAGTRIPVIGPPSEKNGEGIAVLPNGQGYVTISEGEKPVIYFFRAQCSSPPEFTVPLKDKTVFVGRSSTLGVRAKGYPRPHYRWLHSGRSLPGQTKHVLILRNIKFEDAGDYTVTASNRHGSVTSTATLSVIDR